MTSKLLLVSSLAAAAVALVPPCLPGLGAEFCPSTASGVSYDAYESLHKPVRYPNLTQQNELEKIFSRLNKSRMEEDLVRLTNPNLLPNRYCYSSQGKYAQEKVTNATDRARWYDSTGDWDWETPYHTSVTRKSYTPQYNVQVRTYEPWPPQGQGNIIIGAHMDSINIKDKYSNPDDMVAPGADDNGSGAVVLLEVERVLAPILMEKNPKHYVKFQWYAGEEVGLKGSEPMFQELRNDSEVVIGMLNLDMVGYSGGHTPGSPKIAVQSDEFIDRPLTAFVKKLIKQYSKAEAGDTECGYACSDHASAHRAGYPSAMIGESSYIKGTRLRPNLYPYIHSANDTIDHIDFDYMLEFAKVAAAFIIELAYADFEEL